MKGLLYKDFYTLVRQTKIYLLLVVIFAVMPGYSMTAFGVVYAALLPVTALAYDERSKWNTLAAMMPYSVRELVLSKYVLGWGAIVGSGVLTALVKSVANALQHTGSWRETAAQVPAYMGIAALMLAISLPVMFRFGVERGRLVFFVLVGFFVALIALLSGPLAGAAAGLNVPSMPTAASALAVVLLGSALSVCISIRCYQRRTT